jgi:hypothetical protein
VTGLVNSPIAQYAVIEARRTEGPSERFVIAYSDEESLRDLIAGPSIVGCGFASHQEAQAKIDANFWTVDAWKPTQGALQSRERRNLSPGLYRQSGAWSRVQSDADLESRSWLFPGGCRGVRSRLLFQKCCIHIIPVICWRFTIVRRAGGYWPVRAG